MNRERFFNAINTLWVGTPDREALDRAHDAALEEYDDVAQELHGFRTTKRHMFGALLGTLQANQTAAVAWELANVALELVINPHGYISPHDATPDAGTPEWLQWVVERCELAVAAGRDAIRQQDTIFNLQSALQDLLRQLRDDAAVLTDYSAVGHAENLLAGHVPEKPSSGCGAGCTCVQEDAPDHRGAAMAIAASLHHPHVREELASIVHAIWAHWTEHMLDRLGPLVLLLARDEVRSAGLEERYADIDRWRRQIRSCYFDLSEKERDSDREQADKIISVLTELAEEVLKEHDHPTAPGPGHFASSESIAASTTLGRKTRGIFDVAAERHKQLDLGYDARHDLKRGYPYLVEQAIAILTGRNTQDKFAVLSRHKDRREQLVIAGAIIAAAIDTLDLSHKGIEQPTPEE